MAGDKTALNTQWGRTSDDGVTNIVPAVADNDGREPLVDRSGRLWVRAFGGAGPVNVDLTWDDPPTLLASRVVVAAAAAYHIALGFNDSNNLQYWQLFDAAALPVNGTVPMFSVPVLPKQGTFSLDLRATPRAFSTGIVWAASTTPDTLTLALQNTLWVNVGRTP